MANKPKSPKEQEIADLEKKLTQEGWRKVESVFQGERLNNKQQKATAEQTWAEIRPKTSPSPRDWEALGSPTVDPEKELESATRNNKWAQNIRNASFDWEEDMPKPNKTSQMPFEQALQEKAGHTQAAKDASTKARSNNLKPKPKKNVITKKLADIAKGVARKAMSVSPRNLIKVAKVKKEHSFER